MKVYMVILIIVWVVLLIDNGMMCFCVGLFMFFGVIVGQGVILFVWFGSLFFVWFMFIQIEQLVVVMYWDFLKLMVDLLLWGVDIVTGKQIGRAHV